MCIYLRIFFDIIILNEIEHKYNFIYKNIYFRWIITRRGGRREGYKNENAGLQKASDPLLGRRSPQA